LRGLEWLRRATDLAVSDELRATLEEERARLENLSLLGDILPLIKARKISLAQKLLRERLDQAGSADERARVEALLKEPRTFGVPVNAAPTMSTINGLGSALYGKRAPRSDGTYVATLYFVVLFVPLIPIAAYVVRAIHPGWQFFAKVPLTRFQIWWRRLALLVPLLLIGGSWAAYEVENSPWRKETVAISRAEEALARNDGSAALYILVHVRGSRDAVRAARVQELGVKATDAELDSLHGPDDVRLFLKRSARLIDAKWTSTSTADRVERVAMEVARQKDGAPAAAAFIRWAWNQIPAFVPRKPAVAQRASDVADDPDLDALALHAPALDRMERRLRAGRFPGWNERALEFIAAAPPERSRAMLYLRAEAAWKGTEPPGDLAHLQTLPPPLNLLFKLDQERSPAKRVDGLEALEEFKGLPEPAAGWHRLGVARRLSSAYTLLNEEDAARWPIAKARAWTLKAHESAPDDPELRLRALRILVDEGDYAKAVAIGEAGSADPKALVWLGVAYGRSDRPGDAARVLRPFVAEHLETYLKNYEQWDARHDSQSKRLYAALSNGTADQAVLRKLSRLSGATADAEADRWVRERLDADPQLKKLAAAWGPIEAVYSAALELAMAELALATGDSRPARLREAERLFVQLRRVSRDPHQELQLGQVYFWLGKPAEGQKIFESLEKTGDGEVLFKMGGIFRELDRDADARRVLEAAYANLKGEKRFDAALRRAYAWKSLEDRRDWLQKCDTKTPHIRSELSQVHGEIFLRDGRYEEAALELKEAAAYHAKLGESEKSFNNAAMLELDIARATGDVARLATARSLLRKAVDKEPQDAIVLNNHLDSLRYLGYHALSAEALRVKILHDLPSVHWLDWRLPPLSTEAWAAATRERTELRQAAELGPRAAILASDHSSAIYSQLNYAWLTRDAAAVRALRTSLESRAAERPPQIDAPDDPKASKKAPVDRSSIWTDRVAAARKAGHSGSLAYLLVRLASDTFTSDPAGSLKATLEARELHDCPATRRYLMAFRASRAARAWSARDPAFKKWEEDVDLNDELALSAYFAKHPDKIAEFRATEEVKLLTAAAEEAAALPPVLSTFRIWRALRLAGSPKEAALKASITRDTIQLDTLLMDVAMDGTLTDVIDAWQAAELYGDAALVERLAADARRRKLFPALFGE
jgi:hypothetical protein